MKCKCPPGSPFHWEQEKRPSIFLQDKTYSYSHQSAASTQRIAEARATGQNVGYLHGISRNREAEILRMRNFTIFSKASPGG